MEINKAKLKLKLITHFEECEEEDFDGEYWGVSLWYNDKLIKSYGDYYHEKGEEKMEGFLDGLMATGYELEVEEICVNDCFELNEKENNLYDLLLEEFWFMFE